MALAIAIGACGIAEAAEKHTTKAVQISHSVSVFRLADTCTKFQAFMGLEHGMGELTKTEDSGEVRFRNQSGPVETFPSPLSVMVLINQHSCKAPGPDTAAESEMLKDLEIKLEWYDGHVRRPVGNSSITRRASSLKEIFQVLSYDVIVPAEDVSITDHLFVTFSGHGTQFGSLDLHF